MSPKLYIHKASDGGGVIRSTCWPLSPCPWDRPLADSTLTPAVTADKGQQGTSERTPMAAATIQVISDKDGPAGAEELC